MAAIANMARGGMPPKVRCSEDDALADFLAQLRPSPAELALLWPPNERARIVIVVRSDAAGVALVSARVRELEFEVRDADVVRRIRKVRGDVPVIIERAGGVRVFPLRALSAGATRGRGQSHPRCSRRDQFEPVPEE